MERFVCSDFADLIRKQIPSFGYFIRQEIPCSFCNKLHGIIHFFVPRDAPSYILLPTTNLHQRVLLKIIQKVQMRISDSNYIQLYWGIQCF